MLDELHVDVAGEKGELDRTQFSKGPAFPAATRRHRLIPNGRDFFAQLLLFDLHQAGKKFRDFFNSIFALLSWFHGSHLDYLRSFYFWLAQRWNDE